MCDLPLSWRLHSHTPGVLWRTCCNPGCHSSALFGPPFLATKWRSCDMLRRPVCFIIFCLSRAPKRESVETWGMTCVGLTCSHIKEPDALRESIDASLTVPFSSCNRITRLSSRSFHSFIMFCGKAWWTRAAESRPSCLKRRKERITAKGRNKFTHFFHRLFSHWLLYRENIWPWYPEIQWSGWRAGSYSNQENRTIKEKEPIS